LLFDKRINRDRFKTALGKRNISWGRRFQHLQRIVVSVFSLPIVE
jgi:hypothetical protein